MAYDYGAKEPEKLKIKDMTPKQKELLIDSDTFCMLPFMHIYGSAGGDMVPCCEAQEVPLNEVGEGAEESWNNHNYKELRRALANGERPKRCDVCWHNESSGIVSNRQQWEKDNWRTFSDQISVNNDYSVNNKPLWIELKVSNSTGKEELRCSLRMGPNMEEPVGVVSISTTLPAKKDIMINQSASLKRMTFQ